MKQLSKILILFVFVYVTFALGKELYTQDQDALVSIPDDTTSPTEVPLLTGEASATVEQDSTDSFITAVQQNQGRRDRSSDNDDSSDTSSEQLPLSGAASGVAPQTTGYFLMGTDDTAAVFWGLYDSQSHTFQGETRWYGNSNLVRAGVGSYIPTGPDAGSLQVNFSDPYNSADPGLNWAGTYGNGRWTISNNETGSLATLTGRVFQAPQ